MMEIKAFQNYNEISNLASIQDKHRAWLKHYEGKMYSIAEEGKHKMKWASEKRHYSDNSFNPEINMIAELGNRIRIEFDDKDDKGKKDKGKIAESLKEVLAKIEEMDWGYIISSHGGSSDYIWLEFTKNLKDNEKEAFLKWIAPEKSEIDLNFASSKRVFPVLFAIHWKKSYNREMPIKFKEGKKVDYDSLNIPLNAAGRIIQTIQEDGYVYPTFKRAGRIFSKIGQTEEFARMQPIFYDRSGSFWLWNERCTKWEMVDDIDVLNMIAAASGEDIISSKNRNEILNGLKQEGRKRIPKEVKPTWIQFKNKIYDISNGDEFDATPEYFVTNPIPWELDEDRFMETPVMDRIFEEWVGKE